MKKTLLDGSLNEYRFDLTDNEVCHRIYECLKPTNKELEEKDIFRNKYAREYNAVFFRPTGEEVNVSIGIGNLKRFFGAWVLAFKEDGIWFNRTLKKSKNTH